MSDVPEFLVKNTGSVLLARHEGGQKSGILCVASSMSDESFTFAITGGGSFTARRFFLIYGVDSHTIRADHAQWKTSEVLFCVAGKCQLDLDDGETRQVRTLDDPSIGVFIGAMVWRRLSNFSPDCVLLAFTDTRLYDPTDYITDYQVFLSQSGEAH